MTADYDIERAVNAAIATGMTAKQFMQRAWECWEGELQDKAKRGGDAFREAVRGKVEA